MAKTKRLFRFSATDTIVACATIFQSAGDHRQILENLDNTYSKDFFFNLNNRINDAVKLLGINSIADLLSDSEKLRAIHKTAMQDLQLVKAQIEVKFEKEPATRDRLLSLLGFKQHYVKAFRYNQEAMLQLLETFAQNLSEDLASQFVAKGISQQRLDNILAAGQNYHSANVQQETSKGRSKQLSADTVKAFNEIYKDIVGLCKIARIAFKDQPEIKDRFTFDKVVKRISSAAQTATKEDTKKQQE